MSASDLTQTPALITETTDATTSNGKARVVKQYKCLYNNVEFGRFTGKYPKQASCKAFRQILLKMKPENYKNGDNISFTLVEYKSADKKNTYVYNGSRVELAEPVKVQIKVGDATRDVFYKFKTIIKRDSTPLVLADAPAAEQTVAPTLAPAVLSPTPKPVRARTKKAAAAPVKAPTSAPVVAQSAAPVVAQSAAPVVAQSAAPVVAQSAAPVVAQSAAPVVAQSAAQVKVKTTAAKPKSTKGKATQPVLNQSV